MRRTTALRSTALYALAAIAVPLAAFGQQQPDPHAIVVSGSATIATDPDAATVRLGVVRQASSAESAQQQANTAAKQILSAVGKLGIPAQRIRTSRLTLTPNYQREQQRIVSYSASNIITIELDDLSRIGPAIDAGLKAGANQLEGVDFRLKDDATVREQALRRAVMEARGKAEAIAGALGVKLMQVIEVVENGVSLVPRAEFSRATLAADTPVSPGQLDVTASVTIKYRIP
jgi:uncharacterized protein YggE